MRLMSQASFSLLLAAIVAAQLSPLSSASAQRNGQQVAKIAPANPVQRSLIKSLKHYAERKTRQFDEAFAAGVRTLTPLVLETNTIDLQVQRVEFVEGSGANSPNSYEDVAVFLFDFEPTSGSIPGRELYLDPEGRMFIRHFQGSHLRVATRSDIANFSFHNALTRTGDGSSWANNLDVLATLHEKSGKTVTGARVLEHVTAAKRAFEHALQLKDAGEHLLLAKGTLSGLSPLFQGKRLEPIDGNEVSLANLWRLVKVKGNGWTVPLVVAPHPVTIPELEREPGEHERYQDYTEPREATLFLSGSGFLGVDLNALDGRRLFGRRFQVNSDTVARLFPLDQVRKALVETLVTRPSPRFLTTRAHQVLKAMQTAPNKSWHYAGILPLTPYASWRTGKTTVKDAVKQLEGFGLVTGNGHGRWKLTQEGRN